MKPKVKEQYAEFVEHIEFPTIIYIYETGRIIGQNRRAREILGTESINMNTVWAEQKRQKISKEWLDYGSRILYNKEIIAEGRIVQIDIEMNAFPLDKTHLIVCFLERSHKQQFVRYLQIQIPRLFVKNEKLEYLLTNTVFGKDAGRTSFRGRKDQEFLDPFFCKLIEDDEYSLMQEKECSYGLQQIIKIQKSEGFYARFNRIPLLTKEETCRGIMVIYSLVPGRDEYKRLFDSLLKENNLLNATINKSDTVVISWFDEPGWPVDYISPNINKFGFTARDFYDKVKCWKDIVHPEDYERIVSQSNDKNQGLILREYRLVRADGTVILVRDEAIRKCYNGVTYLQATLTGLIKEDEDKLEDHSQSSLKRYREFLSGVPDGLELQASPLGNQFSLERYLREAIKGGCVEFDIYYQPIISSRTKELCSAEALIRWTNKKLGSVNTIEFIPLSEYLGLIVPLGEYVIREVFRVSCQWAKKLGRTLPLSINLSVVQLVQPNIVKRICSIAKEMNVDCGKIIFEVTESLAVEDINLMKNVLLELKSHGFKIALDDFGSGYSSLNHIMEMPLDFIKVDRTFIAAYGTKQFNPSLLSAIIEVGHSMDVEIIVEGVETKQQMEFLMFLNADRYQGYYYGKPMPEEEFCEKYIESVKG